ncbi:MAG: hypothetical protein Tsb005_10400 [Gammaproteobacteria bacterium]
MLHKIDRNYKSPEDELLKTLRKKFSLSASQVREINKHKLIAKKRDHADTRSDDSKLWENF